MLSYLELMKQAILVFNDQIVFGTGVGREGIYNGELVFNTSMYGYTEVLSDPSYAGQILTFTYPLIGNYGVNQAWFESKQMWPEALVISQVNASTDSDDILNLDKWLERSKRGGICNVDTRAIVLNLRESGVCPATLIVYEQKTLSTLELIKMVSTKSIRTKNTKGKKTVALIDTGHKSSISDDLTRRGLRIDIIPYLKMKLALDNNYDGYVFANGPGDPAELPELIALTQQVLGLKRPVLGICLGHQLVGLALGAKTYKLKYGHRGGNHPVQDLNTGKAYITSQNHGYAIDKATLPKGLSANLINLNDSTVEGLVHESLPIITTQFHPEASAGPNDTKYIFDIFAHELIGI